jgi:competence protein ComEC
VKKPASFKAEASFNYCIRSDSIFRQDGKIILYFSKENGNAETLHCGSRLLFRVNPREINYTANPGGFDYKRYALFKGITHQVFLRGDDYYQLPFQNRWSIKPLIENCRQHIVSILRKNIPGEKEKGMAEALLIGYKQDLDPSLVRSYANTGVAHVIAISGADLLVA